MYVQVLLNVRYFPWICGMRSANVTCRNMAATHRLPGPGWANTVVTVTELLPAEEKICPIPEDCESRAQHLGQPGIYRSSLPCDEASQRHGMTTTARELGGTRVEGRATPRRQCKNAQPRAMDAETTSESNAPRTIKAIDGILYSTAR